MGRSTISSKGRVTLPKAVRDELRLHAGSRIDFFVEEGRVIGTPVKITLDQLANILPRATRHVSLEEMDGGTRAQAVRRYKRSTR